jgi:branched-chain amino acid transport system substrate-binding protein
VQVAVDEANAQGGIHGHPLELDIRDAQTPEEAISAVNSLDHQVSIIIGAYSSQLSIPTATAASHDHLVYWESGAVADRLTGSGSPLIFRVGIDGMQLGTNSAKFAGSILAPRLGRQKQDLRVVIVNEDDSYGASVAAGVNAEAHALGFQVAAAIHYNAYDPNWSAVLGRVKQVHPDVLFLASYIPDGVAFRKAMIAAKIKVGALIGTTMSECVPDFGKALGAESVGIFGSDRPGPDFNPKALNRVGRQAYDILAKAVQHDKVATVRGIPTEEELSGFTASWSLVHFVLPSSPAMTAKAIATSARRTDIPSGDLPNGSGLKFSQSKGTIGQNTRATGAIWQWQASDYNVVVWPSTFATTSPVLVPLPVGVAAVTSTKGATSPSSGGW